MSKLYIESEYDLDQALAEVIRLTKFNGSQLDIGFNNMVMVNIFLKNLHEQLILNKIAPDKKNLSLNILVKTGNNDEPT